MTSLSTPLPLSAARRLLMLFGFGSVIAASWIYLGLMIRDMSAIPGMAGTMTGSMGDGITDRTAGMAGMTALDPLAPAYVGGLIVMWTVMQAAMMLPSALPMICGFARMKAAERGRPRLVLPVALFAGGYVAAWSAFSVAAALLQTALTGSGLLSAMSMEIPESGVAGAILVVAGLYQWMPLKLACLRLCRTPFGFLTTEWREGRLGPLFMGWRHGLFCIGCCWAIMTLLFAAGIMNPIWIVGIAVYVLAEKIVPHGETVTRLAGVALIAGGIGTMLGGS